MSPIGEKAAIAIVFLVVGSAAGVGVERLHARNGHADSAGGASRDSDATGRVRVELASARAEDDALPSELHRPVEGRGPAGGSRGDAGGGGSRPSTRRSHTRSAPVPRFRRIRRVESPNAIAMLSRRR